MNKKRHFKKRSRKNNLFTLTLIIIFCLCTSVPIVLNAGSHYTTNLQVALQKKITINIDNKSLKYILIEIQRLSGIGFGIEKLAGDKSLGQLSLHVKDVSVEQALTTLLAKTNYTYQIIDNIITILKKTDAKESKKEASTEVKKIMVSGTVFDTDKNPIVGATVIIEGTPTGSITDAKGAFMFIAESNAVIEVSFIGKKSVIVDKIESGKVLNITMTDDALAVDDVVITGYQNLKRKDNTGSTTTIKSSDLNLTGVTNIADALQGQVAGMIVTNSSSRVGTSSKIQIRGTTTILGNQDPIWVVDGIIQDDPISINALTGMVDDMKNIIGNQVSWLNPDDIETITVLKDASATAIYGSRASNGVIVISLKKAKTDRVSINYAGSISYQGEPNYGQYNLMNSQERIKFSDEAFNAGAIYSSLPIAQPYLYEGALRMFTDGQLSANEFMAQKSKLETVNTDWLSLIARPTFSHKHNLSVTGMSGKVNYNVSIGYNKANGQEIGNDNENFTTRASIGININSRLKVDMSINGSVNSTNGYGKDVNPLNYALNTSRAISAYEDNGDLSYYRLASAYSGNYNRESTDLGYNILNEMNNSYSKVGTGGLSLNLNLEYKICSWLKYQFTGGYQYTSTDRESYSGERTFNIANTYRGYDYGSVNPGNPWIKAAFLPSGGELFTDNGKSSSINIQNKLLISKTFKDDSRLNIMLATEVRSNPKNTLSNTVYGYIPERGNMIVSPTTKDNFVSLGNSGWSGFGKTFDNLYNGRWAKGDNTDNFFSIFATAAYSFRNRYVINANIRNDASNRFGQNVNRRLDPTFSFGLAWHVKDEPFLQNRAKWLSSMTLKATYGIQGNALLNKSPEVIFKQSGSLKIFNEYYSSIMSIPNPNLSWERTKTWNYGLDMRLFNAVNIVADYYSRSSNAIIQQEIPSEYGIRMNTMDVNGGLVYNRGAEVTISFSPVNTKNFGFNVSINSSKNWNKTGPSKQEPVLQNFISGTASMIVKEGYPLGAMWSYTFDGLNPQTGYPTYKHIPLEEGATYNGDPSSLLTYNGSTLPDFTGGLNLGVRYKKLTLSTSFVLLMGGVKRLPSPYANFDNFGRRLPDATKNLSKDIDKRWRKPGDEKTTNIPAIYTSGTTTVASPFIKGTNLDIYDIYRHSDVLTVNSSFLRCNNLSVGYSFDEKLVKKLRISSLRISGTVNNLFVITSKEFNGYDPELGNSVMPKTFSFGINIGF